MISSRLNFHCSLGTFLPTRLELFLPGTLNISFPRFAKSNFFPQNNTLWTNSPKQSSKNFSCCGRSRKRYSLEKRYFRLKGEIAFSGQVFYTDVKQRFWAFQRCLDLVSYCKIKDRICSKHIPSSKKRNFASIGQVF